MKKIIIALLIVAASVGLYFSTVSYVGRIKDNTLQRNVVRPLLSDKLPIGFDSVYVEQMSKLGMNTTKEALLLLYTKQRQYWKEKFGLTFMGDSEMTSFLSENKFILGEANRYLYMIPVSAGKIMIENVNRINPPNKKMYRYWLTMGETWILNEEDLNIKPNSGEVFENCYMDDERWLKIVKKSAFQKYGLIVNCHAKIKLEPPTENKIFIIGSAKEFNTDGMTIEDGILKANPPKDPIAVLKVNNGYAELASWE